MMYLLPDSSGPLSIWLKRKIGRTPGVQRDLSPSLWSSSSAPLHVMSLPVLLGIGNGSVHSNHILKAQDQCPSLGGISGHLSNLALGTEAWADAGEFLGTGVLEGTHFWGIAMEVDALGQAQCPPSGA